MLSFSTGHDRKRSNGTASGSWRDLYASGQLLILSGSIPANADQALGGASTVWTIDLPNSAGFDADASGKTDLTVSNLSGITAAGVGTFFRLIQAGDDHSLDTAGLWARVQGTVGLITSNPDFVVFNTTFVVGTRTLENFRLY